MSPEHMPHSQRMLFQFLFDRVFRAPLESSRASKGLKEGVRLTMQRMLRLGSAWKMWHYFWSVIHGTEKSIRFSEKMKAEKFPRFEEVIDDFRVRFPEEWARKADQSD